MADILNCFCCERLPSVCDLDLSAGGGVEIRCQEAAVPPENAGQTLKVTWQPFDVPDRLVVCVNPTTPCTNGDLSSISGTILLDTGCSSNVPGSYPPAVQNESPYCIVIPDGTTVIRFVVEGDCLGTGGTGWEVDISCDFCCPSDSYQVRAWRAGVLTVDSDRIFSLGGLAVNVDAAGTGPFDPACFQAPSRAGWLNLPAEGSLHVLVGPTPGDEDNTFTAHVTSDIGTVVTEDVDETPIYWKPTGGVGDLYAIGINDISIYSNSSADHTIPLGGSTAVTVIFSSIAVPGLPPRVDFDVEVSLGGEVTITNVVWSNVSDPLPGEPGVRYSTFFDAVF